MKKKNSIQIKFLLEGNIGKTGNILKNREKKLLGGQRANGQITREKYFGRKKNSFFATLSFLKIIIICILGKGYNYVSSPFFHLFYLVKVVFCDGQPLTK